HCRRNRRLGHPTLTQQHHLDALALRRRYLPAQRSFQPPHLGFAAFDHLFSPNQMAQANHTSGEENSPRLSAKNSDSSRYGGSIKGIHCVKVKLATGEIATYYYAWRKGPRLVGVPGSPEFLASYTAGRSLAAAVVGFRRQLDSPAPKQDRPLGQHSGYPPP